MVVFAIQWLLLFELIMSENRIVSRKYDLYRSVLYNVSDNFFKGRNKRDLSESEYKKKNSLEGSQEDFNKSIEVILVAVLIGVEEIVLVILKQITESNKVSI